MIRHKSFFSIGPIGIIYIIGPRPIHFGKKFDKYTERLKCQAAQARTNLVSEK